MYDDIASCWMCTRSRVSHVYGARRSTIHEDLLKGIRIGIYLVCSSEVPQLGIAYCTYVDLVIVPLFGGYLCSVLWSLTLRSSNPRTIKPTLVELLSLNTCLYPARSPVHEATQYASGCVDQRGCARATSSTRRRNMARHHGGQAAKQRRSHDRGNYASTGEHCM